MVGVADQEAAGREDSPVERHDEFLKRSHRAKGSRRLFFMAGVTVNAATRSFAPDYSKAQFWDSRCEWAAPLPASVKEQA
jgi:hypothetical protein